MGVPSDSIPLVRQIAPGDRDWVAKTRVEQWTSTSVARRGELVEAAGLPGYLATLDGRRVGRALMERCFAEALATGCWRVWLMTTDNNIAAIRHLSTPGHGYVRAASAARAVVTGAQADDPGA